MKTTWWDIKTEQIGWTGADYDMHRFFMKLGSAVKATIHEGYAYVFVYNADKPSKSLVLKSKM